MKINSGISLVMPVFNEAEIIEETVRVYLDDLEEKFSSYELIVVDDGSTDATAKILEKLKSFYPDRLRVITNQRNTGSGASLYKGLLAARFAFVASNFADRPFDLKELKNIMPIFDQEIDFVVVCRKDRSANTFYRKMTSLVNYYLIRILFQINVGDFQFVQIYRRKILEDLDVKSQRTFVPAEIIIKLLRRGYKMAEYRTDFHSRSKGRAKCGHPRVIFRALFDMLRFRFVGEQGISVKGR